jgi:hypothetical protein
MAWFKKNVYFTMMKKCFTILLLTIYLLGTTGVVLSKHFCGSKISHISLLGNKKSCKCGKVKMPKSCCKDTSVKLSTDDNQRLSAFDFIPNNNLDLTGVLHQNYTMPVDMGQWSQQCASQFYVCKTGPPPVPMYIFTHTLLI